ncbi:MAG: hypothetical protein NVS1B14_06370 [Vulcanimicrobiaceae bacterium]
MSVAFIAALLAGCGSGGGSVLAPVVLSGPTKVAQKADAKTAAADQRLATMLARYVKPGRKKTLGLRRVIETQMRHRALAIHIQDTTVSPCQDGVIETVTTNPDGSSVVQDKGFWDPTCVATALMYLSTSNLSAPGVNGAVTVAGTQTNYKEDGTTVTGYDVTNMVVYNSNAGSGNFVISNAHYANQAAATAPNAVALSTDYYAELETASGIQVGSVSISPDNDNPGQTVADAMNYTVTSTAPDATGNVTITLVSTGQSLVDPTGKMSVAFPLAAGTTAWVLSGGTQTAAYTGTTTMTVDNAGLMLSYSYALKDLTNDLTTTIVSSNAGQTFTGTLTQTSTGSVLATFTVDANGTGSITYPDGSTGAVTNWCFP